MDVVRRRSSEQDNLGKQIKELTHIDRTQVFGVNENEQRGNWTGRMDFVLATLGYAVGLGNFWRFPYLCYRNGGGAFLVPYLIFMTIVGIPLFFVEAGVGQFSSAGPTACWGLAPIFSGIGIAMMICSSLKALYYTMVLAWCIFYFVMSFQIPLPWASCENEWNTDDCRLRLPDVDCGNYTRYVNGTCYDSNGTFLGLWNTTIFTDVTGRQRVSPSEEYFNNYVLGLSSDIEDLGAPRWKNVIFLFTAWFISFLCLVKGIKSTGKVVYFTVTFPYLLLVILFFRGVILENAWDGIKFYIVPDFNKLSSAKVWRDAATQIFYSIGNAYGGIITLSSYNRFHNNALRDSLVVSIGNCMTSIFGGFVIFSYIGFMAGQLAVPVKDVVKSGAGLVFVIYPEALNNLPGATFWAIVFFFMLITLGLDSQFAIVETVLTGIADVSPRIRQHKTLAIGALCFLGFLLGLPMCTDGGLYVLQVVDYYNAAFSLLLIGLAETIAVIFVYGLHRFCMDIELMTGKQPYKFFKVTWTVTCPIGISFILIFAWIDYSPITYGDDGEYPLWVHGIGWCISLVSVIFIPIGMIYKIITAEQGGNFIHRVKTLIKPSRLWGPALVKHRELVTYVEGFDVDPYNKKATEIHQLPGGVTLNMNVSLDMNALDGRKSSLTLIPARSSTQPMENSSH